MSAEMDRHPDQSRYDVFGTVVNKLTTFQQQLDDRYHGDHFVRDRLLKTLDIPMQASLRDRMPRSAQYATNYIASKLSEKLKTAGTSTSVNISTAEDEKEGPQHLMYTLRQKYTHGAKREIKTYGPRNPYTRG